MSDKDVKIIETQSPNEIVPFLNGQADYAFTLEPNTSLAVTKGSKVVLSYPQKLGDQVFTGLMTTEDFISQHPDTVQAVVNAYQHALQDLKANPLGGIATASVFTWACSHPRLAGLERSRREGLFYRLTGGRLSVPYSRA